MKIDFERQIILLDDKKIYLTRIQSNILNLFYNNINQLVTYKDIAEEVYQLQCDTFLKVLIRKHISLLRKKLEGNIKIETIRNVGYIIEEELK